MTELVLSGLASRTPVRLVGGGPELEQVARQAWSRCLERSSDDDGPTTDPVTVELREAGVDVTGLYQFSSQDALMESLTQHVTRAKIRAQAGRLFMFHAGALAHPTSGAAIGFVAQGGTGKTTLMRTLGTTYSYVTDETLAVGHDRFVLPYPKPLSIRKSGHSHKVEVSPDELGLAPTLPRPRLSKLVLLRRTSDHDGPPTVEPLDTIEAITALGPETSSLSALPRPLHAMVELLEGLDETVRLSYGEVETVVDLIADWMERA